MTNEKRLLSVTYEELFTRDGEPYTSIRYVYSDGSIGYACDTASDLEPPSSIHEHVAMKQGVPLYHLTSGGYCVRQYTPEVKGEPKPEPQAERIEIKPPETATPKPKFVFMAFGQYKNDPSYAVELFYEKDHCKQIKRELFNTYTSRNEALSNAVAYASKLGLPLTINDDHHDLRYAWKPVPERVETTLYPRSGNVWEHDKCGL